MIHDDVLATGGTVEAIKGLVEQLGGVVVGACFIIELTFLGHPLYYYAGDGKTSGSTKGEGLDTFGGSWYAVDGGGKAVEPASAGDMGSEW